MILISMIALAYVTTHPPIIEDRINIRIDEIHDLSSNESEIRKGLDWNYSDFDGLEISTNEVKP